jgi:hypothetical protein
MNESHDVSTGAARASADAGTPAPAGRAPLAQALRPVGAISVILAVVTATMWLMLRYVFPGISALLAVALAVMSTIGGIAIVVSAGDGVPHQDRRAQDLVGLALVIAMFGPAVALVTLLIIMF